MPSPAPLFGVSTNNLHAKENRLFLGQKATWPTATVL
jgi:hypothetical protein